MSVERFLSFRAEQILIELMGEAENNAVKFIKDVRFLWEFVNFVTLNEIAKYGFIAKLLQRAWSLDSNRN